MAERLVRSNLSAKDTDVADPIPQVVYVKYRSGAGVLEIARHTRPSLLSPSNDMTDYVSEIVHAYKSNTQLTYMGLADEEEYIAFQKLNRIAGV